MDTWSQKRAWREAQLRSVLSSRAELAKKRTSRIVEHRILQVRFSADSVAKLSLRRLAIRDSIGFMDRRRERRLMGRRENGQGQFFYSFDLPCGPNSDPANRRSAVPDDQLGPPSSSRLAQCRVHTPSRSREHRRHGAARLFLAGLPWHCARHRSQGHRPMDCRWSPYT